jgi:predicted transcriptional regulator
MTTHASPLDLPEDYALVLQQILASGEEDFTGLSKTLNITRQRLSHIIAFLKQKHLILLDRTTYAESWIRLSSQGRHFVHALWPEARSQYA